MEKVSLRDFVRDIMDAPVPGKTYMFDEDDFLTKSAAPLLNTIKIPDVLAKIVNPSNVGKHKGGIRIFTALGASGSVR